MKTHSRLAYFFALVAFTLGCQSTADQQQAGAAEVTSDFQPVVSQRLAPADFATKLETLPNEQLIDVRTPAEYQTGHLAHSVLIDFKGGNFREKMAQLDKHQPVMVYCAAGGRSTATVALLEELGFTEVYELGGGITGWQEAGQEIEQ